MTDELKGLEAARATRDKIAQEQKEAQDANAMERVDAEKGIEIAGKLAEMYNQSANVGTENLSGNAPYLKVHSTGRSTTNTLANGNDPQDGWFFYAPTQEQMEKVLCHILTISRGFYTEEKDAKTGQKKRKWNQLLAGILLNDGEMKPFIMFITGKRLSPMWDFGKTLRQWTKRKPIPYPMFAMQVELSTHREKNEHNSYSWIIDFNLVKDENQQPVLIMDEGKFSYVKDMVELMQEQIEEMINKKEISEEDEVIDARATSVEGDPGPSDPH
jgi:hypothetical protein